MYGSKCGNIKFIYVQSEENGMGCNYVSVEEDNSGFGSELFYINNIFLGLVWKLTSKCCDLIMFINCFTFLGSRRGKQHLLKKMISKSGLLHLGKLHQNNRPCRLGIQRVICTLEVFGSHDFYCLSAEDQWTDNLKGVAD